MVVEIFEGDAVGDGHGDLARWELNFVPDDTSSSPLEVGVADDLGVVAAVLAAALLEIDLMDVLSPTCPAMLKSRTGCGLM